jgi:hypothetical protein
MLGAHTPLSRDARWVERQRVTSTCRRRGEQKRLSAGCTHATGCVSQLEVGRRKRGAAGAARSHEHNCRDQRVGNEMPVQQSAIPQAIADRDV